MTPGRLMVTACLLLVLGVPDLAAAASRRVPILHSFGRDFGPFQVFSSAFRTVLVRDSPVAQNTGNFASLLRDAAETGPLPPAHPQSAGGPGRAN